MTTSDPADWNIYWRTPSVTSFGEVFPSNYDGPIRDFWEAQLTDSVEEVVDVACGNGALVWIANEILNRYAPKARVTGVDFSDIDPFTALGRRAGDYPSIRFVGNTPAEKLPFADASVDVVISQYGIEYTELSESIPEVMRVLKPTGRMAFVMHNSDSSVVAVATRHLNDFKAVYDLGIHDYALQLNELGRRLPTPEQRQNSPRVRELTSVLNTMTNQVRNIVRDYKEQSPIHHYMNGLMSVFAGDPGAAGDDPARLVRTERDKLHGIIKRIEHLQAAAVTPDTLDGLVGLIEQSGGAAVERSVLGYRHEENIGTALVATRGKLQPR